VATFREAGARHGVPADVLAALAFATSRGSMRGGAPSRDGGYGLADLHEGTTLTEAARRTGLLREELIADAASNVEGGAAVLGHHLGGGRDATALRAALVSYGDAPLADEVARALGTGASFEDDEGLTVSFAPWPEEELPAPPLGVHEQWARPDYPDAEWVGPACSYTNSSRSNADLQAIVIHTCQGGFAGCWGWLVGCHDVSAHYVVRSSDGHVVQGVEAQDVAWHDACNNSHTIGIEHEGFVDDPGRWFTDEMYCGSAELVRWLCDHHGIPCDRDHVYGHGEAPDCSDHTDPGGGWDWGKFMRYVRDGCRCTPATETCNRRDDDCDGEVDEGVLNRCGGCGPEPAEACNCEDDDCDGTVDEAVCPDLARPADGSSPRRLEAGARAAAWVTFANEGTETWLADDVVLRAIGERSDLGVPGEWPAYDVPARLPHDVPAGESARVELPLAAAADAPLGPRSLVLALTHADGTALRGPCDGSAEVTLSLEVVAAGSVHDVAARRAPASSGLVAGCSTAGAGERPRGPTAALALAGLLALLALRRPRLVAALAALSIACAGDDAPPAPASGPGTALFPSSFALAPDAVPADDSRSRDAAFLDVDADGDPDAVVAVREGPARLYVNDGTGHLGLAPPSAMPLPDLDAIGLAVGDVNGDGHADVYVAVYALGQDRLLFGDGQGGFSDATSTWLPADASSDHAVALGDLDGDGDLDVVVGAYGEDGAGHRWERVLVNDGDRLEDRTMTMLSGVDDATASLALGDLDGDGDLDLVTCNDGEDDVHLRMLWNDGTGTFAEAPAGAMPAQSERCRRALLGDLDGDGDLDLVAVGRGQDRFYVNDGAAHFLDQTVLALPVDASTGIGALLEDLDADGDLDLVVASDGAQDRLYANDGTGKLLDETLLLPADAARSVGVASADLEGDGDLDLLVTTETGGPDRVLVADPSWSPEP